MKTLKGKLTISQPTSNQGECPVEITVTDESSGCQAVEIRVDLADFARAVMCHGWMDCEIDINDSGVLGKKRELKDVVVDRPKSHKCSKEEATKLAKEHLVDGWEIHNFSDFTNHHRWVAGGKKVTIGLIRFV